MGRAILPSMLLRNLPKGLPNLQLTFVTPEGIETFASHNAHDLPRWWSDRCARLRAGRRDYWIMLNKREFSDVIDRRTGQPVKRLSSCMFEHGFARPMAADETREAFTTDFRTFEVTPAAPDVIFVDFVI